MMNYYILTYSHETKEGMFIPSLNGKTVENKEEFFNNKKCTPRTFYDKDYEFDYLTPMEEGEVKEEPKLIADFHMWIEEEPRRGLFFPISKKFKDILERYNQPEHRFYNAKVLFQKKKYSYFVWRVLSRKYEEYIDFDKTVYNNLSFSRKLLQEKLVIKQFRSDKEVRTYSKAEWDYDWNYERLVMKPSFKDLDYCYVYKLGDGNIVSERLKTAIEEAGLTGIRFEPVPIPIEFSDEVE